MFTKQFWRDTFERMVRGGANVCLVKGAVDLVDGDDINWDMLIALPAWFAVGMVVPLLLSLGAARRDGTVSPASFVKP